MRLDDPDPDPDEAELDPCCGIVNGADRTSIMSSGSLRYDKEKDGRGDGQEAFEGGTATNGNGNSNGGGRGPNSETQWLQQVDQEDQTDSLPQVLRFNWFDIFCILVSILTYVIDLGMDIYMAYVFFVENYIYYFILTLIFVILPSVSMTAFSLRWYVIDMDNQTIPKPSCIKWVIRTTFLLLQVAPVLRYLDALIYGLRSKKAQREGDRYGQYKYYAYMINEDADSTLLRLFEAFMESAPQVTLQLYILIYHFNDVQGPFAGRGNTIQVLAIMTSLVSLAWSLSAYHRSLRYAQQDKVNLSYKGTLLQFLWHICSISARVFALAVFAATYPILIFPVCIAHWFGMLAWLLVQKTRACETQCEEALFNLIVAFIYIFTFFNIRDEPTRYKYVTFYMICFMENTVLLFTWFFSFDITSTEIVWFRVSGLVGDYALFFVGILCMVLYYVYFHPTVGLKNGGGSNNKAPSTASMSMFPSDFPPNLKKPLARKGSIDAGQLVGCHASSSRRSHLEQDILNTNANAATLKLSPSGTNQSSQRTTDQENHNDVETTL